MKVPKAQASSFSQLSSATLMRVPLLIIKRGQDTSDFLHHQFTQALHVPLWRVGRQSSENRVLVNEY